jgi:hypothetical protein
MRSADTVVLADGLYRGYTLAGASIFSVPPRDAEEMKKAGSDAGWRTDTAAREEVAQIRVLSVLATISSFLVQDVTN